MMNDILRYEWYFSIINKISEQIVNTIINTILLKY